MTRAASGNARHRAARQAGLLAIAVVVAVALAGCESGPHEPPGPAVPPSCPAAPTSSRTYELTLTDSTKQPVVRAKTGDVIVVHVPQTPDSQRLAVPAQSHNRSCMTSSTRHDDGTLTVRLLATKAGDDDLFANLLGGCVGNENCVGYFGELRISR